MPNGLEPGTDLEKILDGWTVKYDRYIVTIGNFRASRSAAPGDMLTDPSVYVLDLKKAPAGGYVISTFTDATAQRWDRLAGTSPTRVWA